MDAPGTPKRHPNLKKSAQILFEMPMGAPSQRALEKKWFLDPPREVPMWLPYNKNHSFRMFHKVPSDHLFAHFGPPFGPLSGPLGTLMGPGKRKKAFKKNIKKMSAPQTRKKCPKYPSNRVARNEFFTFFDTFFLSWDHFAPECLPGPISAPISIEIQ